MCTVGALNIVKGGGLSHKGRRSVRTYTPSASLASTFCQVPQSLFHRPHVCPHRYQRVLLQAKHGIAERAAEQCVSPLIELELEVEPKRPSGQSLALLCIFFFSFVSWTNVVGLVVLDFCASEGGIFVMVEEQGVDLLGESNG